MNVRFYLNIITSILLLQGPLLASGTDTLLKVSFVAETPASWWQVSTSTEFEWTNTYSVGISSTGGSDSSQHMAVITSPVFQLTSDASLSLVVNLEHEIGTKADFRIEIQQQNWIRVYQGSGSYAGEIVVDFEGVAGPMSVRFIHENEGEVLSQVLIRDILIVEANGACGNRVCDPGETPSSCSDCKKERSEFWVPLGKDLKGEDVTYKRFNRNTQCDDCSERIDLPFEVSLYGVQYRSLYLNANGNLSTSAPWIEFTPKPFCLEGPRLIAPYYADVDIQKCGQIQYYLDEHSLIVTWTDVCHYLGVGQWTGLTNTFQVILRDGAPITINEKRLPSDARMIFNYRDMQWTTGQSSGSMTGFGGAGATVGLNAGDGIQCHAYGQFDHPGYDFKVGDLNGVDHLDFHSIWFDPINTAFNDLEIDTTAQHLTGGSIVQEKIVLFPNPTRGSFSFLIPNEDLLPAQLLITDGAGRIVMNRTIHELEGAQNLTLTEVADGLFFVKLQHQEGTFYQTLAKSFF
ncbi:MAG: nidogen-like domain-containing protein [Bacteroidota bacterium]